MKKAISFTKLSGTLSLSEHADGFWLYDQTRGMNLAMRAKTSTDALVSALEYYQRRLTQVEQDERSLRTKVDAFVGQFVDGGVDDWK